MGTEHHSLCDTRVLILEDDYYLATDLQTTLEAAGATVIGPFGGVAEARDALAGTTPDCAFLDVNLGRGPSFELPRVLAELRVPFAFVTGYDPGTIPAEFAQVPRFEKPVAARRVVEMVTHLLRAR